MSDLASYRASMKRLMDAVDTDEAFKREGFDGRTANLVGGSKSFGASRRAMQAIGKAAETPCDIPPHVPPDEKLK